MLNPHFCRVDQDGGQPSIWAEQLLLAQLLMAIDGIHSQRLVIQALDINLRSAGLFA